MRIGMICYASHGGSGIVATELGAELATRGHEVHFITNDVPVRLNRFRPPGSSLPFWPSLTTSRTPVASSATTGLPAAMASSSTMPWVSDWEEKTKRSIAS